MFKGELGPVLLLGGPRYSSLQWFTGSNYDEKDDDGITNKLAQQLFDLGYDVWVGVPRGQDLSRFNSSLDPDSDDPDTGAAAFWNFGV